MFYTLKSVVLRLSRVMFVKSHRISRHQFFNTIELPANTLNQEPVFFYQRKLLEGTETQPPWLSISALCVTLTQNVTYLTLFG